MRVRLPFERELRVFIPPDVHVNQQFEVEALAQKTANLEFDEEVLSTDSEHYSICIWIIFPHKLYIPPSYPPFLSNIVAYSC